jgi:hypothetical protein
MLSKEKDDEDKKQIFSLVLTRHSVGDICTRFINWTQRSTSHEMAPCMMSAGGAPMDR